MARYVGYDGRKILSVSDTPLKKGLPAPDGILADTLIRDYEVWRGKVILKADKKPWDQLRVALVGVYRIECGISTYNEMLFPEIASRVGEYKIFAEEADLPEEPHVVRCWKRGEPLGNLIESIQQFDPDVILIEHEFGIFPNARHWLSLMTQLHHYKTFVMFHSIFKDHHDKTVSENGSPHILVHTNLGAEIVRARSNRPITVIPHGCKPCISETRHWNTYKSKNTFMQFGFGFEYKGWENSIRVAAELKKKYSDVYFTGLFSESPFNLPLHDRYYLKLIELIKELKVEENVALIRGFASDYVLDCYFRTNMAAIFPYVENGAHTVYGVTGAARIAMAAGIPTVVSKAPMFYDLDGVCPRAGDIEEMAVAIEKIWANRTTQVATQNAFLENNSWAQVAKRHLETFA